MEVMMQSPAVSLEAIMTAISCLCTTNNGGSSPFYSNISSRAAFKESSNNVNDIEEKLFSLETSFRKIQSQQDRIIDALQIKNTDLISETQIVDRCVSWSEHQQQNESDIIHLRAAPLNIVFAIPCYWRDEGNGWMVIQQRFDGSENFYRPWQDYQKGFGRLQGEFWIGLDKIYAITNARPHELLIIMTDFDNDQRYALYSNFKIGKESEGYVLKELGVFLGTSGNSLVQHKGQKFSTYDRYNDPTSENCAVESSGAWWYNDCYTSNLNGLYLGGQVTSDNYARGIVWEEFRGYDYSMKTVKMMLRPK